MKMNMRKSVILAMVMTIVLCASSSCNNSENNELKEDSKTEKKADLESEKEKIREAYSNFLDQLKNENIDGYFSYITDDFIGYDAGHPPINDQEQLRQLLTGLFQNFTFDATERESQEIIIRDDIGIHRHLGKVVLQSKTDTTKIVSDNKYLDIWKKNAAGNWKMYMHTSSPNK